MAFQVEDGTSIPTANSLAAVAFFQSYCGDRGYTVQAAWITSRIQVNLVKATDFLNQKYGNRFSGYPTSDFQGTCWPRDLARRRVSDSNDAWVGLGIAPRSIVLVPSGTVPVQVQQAVCELALIADIQDLAPVISNEDINTVAEKIGPIEIDYTRRPKLAWDVFRKAAMLVQPFCTAGGSQPAIVRA